MKAWMVSEYGNYHDVLSLQDINVPADPGAAGVVLRVLAAGLNFADSLSIAGKYQVKFAPPFVPGSEVVGEVVRAGSDAKLKPGDRVVALCGKGAFAEQCTVAEMLTYPISDDISPTDAAALLVTYQTSLLALVDRAHLQPGETLLVHNGAGGVGTAAIEIGKHLGATVIATASTPEKLDVCRQCGADHVINYRDEDFVDVVKKVTSGRGADVIYDSVGGDTFHRSTKCIAWNGRLIVVGFVGGQIPTIEANRILLKNIAVTGINWPGYQQHQPKRLREAHEQIMQWYRDGVIKPVIYETVAFEELTRGLDLVLSRGSYGKVILDQPTGQ